MKISDTTYEECDSDDDDDDYNNAAVPFGITLHPWGDGDEWGGTTDDCDDDNIEWSANPRASSPPLASGQMMWPSTVLDRFVFFDGNSCKDAGDSLKP